MAYMGLGYTRTTMVITMRSNDANQSESLKINRSSDYSLQFESMKSESLVIAEKGAAVNIFSIFVHTARHATGIGFARSASSLVII